MADWKKIRTRGNVEDRRAFRPALLGGAGMTGIALLLLVNLIGGGDLSSTLNDVGRIVVEQGLQAPGDTSQFEGEDTYEVFVSTVLGSTDDAWEGLFSRMNRTYEEPRLVLFRGATQSGCGGASSATGPHYCPVDRTIYLDETFFDELTTRLGAQGGDVAQAYVIAHEVGHHAQNLLGTLDRADRSNNEVSVKTELQADCYAGLWANTIRDQGILEPGEIREAMDAAAAVGDDRIQERVRGHSDPETFTHGTSDERVGWFTTGYNSSTVTACNTFN